MAVVITRPMPDPKPNISSAYDKVRAAGGSEDRADREALGRLDRPWLPARCHSELREHIWRWCDQVAGWLNEQYAWRPDQLIPPCWPRHPHLAQELPVVAFARWLAEIDPDPTPLELWQRQTYPAFCTRMTARLGPGGCRDGTHADSPALPRLAAYTNPHNTDDTTAAISTDADDQDRPPPGGGTVEPPAAPGGAAPTTPKG